MEQLKMAKLEINDINKRLRAKRKELKELQDEIDRTRTKSIEVEMIWKHWEEWETMENKQRRIKGYIETSTDELKGRQYKLTEDIKSLGNLSEDIRESLIKEAKALESIANDYRKMAGDYKPVTVIEVEYQEVNK